MANEKVCYPGFQFNFDFPLRFSLWMSNYTENLVCIHVNVTKRVQGTCTSSDLRNYVIVSLNFIVAFIVSPLDRGRHISPNYNSCKVDVKKVFHSRISMPYKYLNQNL